MTDLLPPIAHEHAEKQALVRALSAAAFLIFFQAYMIAPLVPYLASALQISERTSGLLVPAYMLPYGISTLFYGPLSDRFSRRGVLGILLIATPPAAALTATAHSAAALMLWRVIAGIATGGIISLTLALIGDLFPYEQRGQPFGWVFGAMAGGMAFGSTFGGLLAPSIGYRGIFLAVAVLTALVAVWVSQHDAVLATAHPRSAEDQRSIFRVYLQLFFMRRGTSVYGYVFLNGAFHSGIFTWLGLYFHERYGLGTRGIGLALLGYGVPGLVLGPAIGRLADRYGRRWIITAGLLLSAAIAGGLCFDQPLTVAATAVCLLSLGYDMTQPLLAGIATTLDPVRRGQCMALNAFALFIGFGIGSLLFDALLARGFVTASAVFALVLGASGLAAAWLFRAQRPPVATSATSQGQESLRNQHDLSL